MDCLFHLFRAHPSAPYLKINMKIYKSLILTAFLAFFMAATAFSALALTIQSIRGSAGPDKTRMVLELDDVADFRALVADGPARLIVELPATRVNDRAVVGLSRLGVSEVRQTQAGGLLRLEFILQYPVKVAQAFMLPRDGDKPDRLVIDYKRVGSVEFKSATSQTLGTLSGRSGGGDSSPGFLGILTRPGKPVDAGVALNDTSQGARNSTQDEPSRTPSVRLRRYTVVIDAGHGGKDPGAIGRGDVYEKNITLASAKELARLLEQSGRYKVIMTRTTDKFILLPERVKIARRAGADLFVSLHADMAVENSDARGLSIYTLSDTASDAQTEKLAAAENKVDLLAGVDLSHEQEDVANILIDLAMRENMNQSRFFAGKIVKSMNTNGIDLLDRPHRYAGFAVLKAPDIPSVLVEMGFLSNPSETRRLQDSDYRRRLMQGLKVGIDGYFTHFEKNNIE